MRASRHSGGELPTGYTALPYLYNTKSTAYLDTGYVATNRCKIEVKFQGTSTTSSKSGVLFGSRKGYNNESLYMRTSVSSGEQTNMTVICGYSIERTIAIETNMSDLNVFGVDAGQFYVNGVVIGTYSDAPTTPYPIYLLRINNAGTPFSTAPIGNLYYAKIWDENGVLVRYYVPAERMSDNKQGLYDLVNGEFNTFN